MASEIDYKAIYQAMLKQYEDLGKALETMAPLAGIGANRSGDAAESPTVGDSHGTALPANISHSTFLSMSMPEAIKALLSIVKKDLAAPEVRDLLLQGGYKSTGTPAQMYPAVFTTLRRLMDKDALFKREDGKWGLAEWYPNRKRPAAKALTGAEIVAKVSRGEAISTPASA